MLSDVSEVLRNSDCPLTEVKVLKIFCGIKGSVHPSWPVVAFGPHNWSGFQLYSENVHHSSSFIRPRSRATWECFLKVWHIVMKTP